MLRLANGDSIRDLGALLARQPLDEPRARRASASRSPRSGTEPVARPLRDRAARADPPLARRCRSCRRRRASRRRRGSSTRGTSPRVFADELARAGRYERPLSLMMVDLDLLREINNTFGHLAGDAVLRGRRGRLPPAAAPLRHPGPLRRGGVLDPPARDARRAGARDRRAGPPRGRGAARSRSRPPATRSGRPSRSASRPSPRTARDQNELIHQADLAVYRAKLQGRNRVARRERRAAAHRRRRTTARRPLGHAGGAARDGHAGARRPPVRGRPSRAPAPARRRRPALPLALAPPRVRRRRRQHRPGSPPGSPGMLLGTSTELAGHARDHRPDRRSDRRSRCEIDQGSISMSAVGALAGAALAGPRPALLLALATAVVAWSAGADPARTSSSSTSARSRSPRSRPRASSRSRTASRRRPDRPRTCAGVVAGAAYFAVNTGLLAVARRHRGARAVVARPGRNASPWLTAHYLFYGFIGAMIAILYDSGRDLRARSSSRSRSGCSARRRRPTSSTRSARRRSCAARPRRSRRRTSPLEIANRLLKERSTAAMECLSATVDARDAYTAGHSRRVQQLVARDRPRDRPLATRSSTCSATRRSSTTSASSRSPTPILLKPTSLTGEEWGMMRNHAEEGARIIGRLGFLARRRARDPPPPRALRRLRLPGRARGRGDPARRADHPRRRRARLDAHDAASTAPPGPPRRRSPSSRPASAPSSAPSACPRSSGSCRWTTTTAARKRSRRSPRSPNEPREPPVRTRSTLFACIGSSRTGIVFGAVLAAAVGALVFWPREDSRTPCTRS